METKKAVAALAALAHEGRLSIYRLLVETGPEGLTVGEIGSKLRLRGATLSFHLAQLKQAGLVHARREGRLLIQTADFDQMNALVGYLTENCCGGRTCAPVCKPSAAPKNTRKRTAA